MSGQETYCVNAMSPIKNRDPIYQAIRGVLMRVSDPNTFVGADGRVKSDYYHLGIKTADGKRVMVYLTTDAMGWGSFQRSKIYYFNAKKGRPTKTSLTNPDRFLGKTFEVTGILDTLNKANRKYRMSHIQEVVIYLD